MEKIKKKLHTRTRNGNERLQNSRVTKAFRGRSWSFYIDFSSSSKFALLVSGKIAARREFYLRLLRGILDFSCFETFIVVLSRSDDVGMELRGSRFGSAQLFIREFCRLISDKTTRKNFKWPCMSPSCSLSPTHSTRSWVLCAYKSVAFHFVLRWCDFILHGNIFFSIVEH